MDLFDRRRQNREIRRRGGTVSEDPHSAARELKKSAVLAGIVTVASWGLRDAHPIFRTLGSTKGFLGLTGAFTAINESLHFHDPGVAIVSAAIPTLFALREVDQNRQHMIRMNQFLKEKGLKLPSLADISIKGWKIPTKVSKFLPTVALASLSLGTLGFLHGATHAIVKRLNYKANRDMNSPLHTVGAILAGESSVNDPKRDDQPRVVPVSRHGDLNIRGGTRSYYDPGRIRDSLRF